MHGMRIVCPEQIPVTRIIHQSREVLAKRGKGPLEQHQMIIDGKDLLSRFTRKDGFQN
jgi:hypothetical protein